jgi:hypothetical protein
MSLTYQDNGAGPPIWSRLLIHREDCRTPEDFERLTWWCNFWCAFAVGVVIGLYGEGAILHAIEEARAPIETAIIASVVTEPPP